MDNMCLLFILLAYVLSYCDGLRNRQQIEFDEAYAVKYLYQHGYIECQRLEATNTLCTGTSLKQAIQTFQKNFLLNVNGIVNEETLDMMRVKRCANVDVVSTSGNSNQIRSRRSIVERQHQAVENTEPTKICYGRECIKPKEKEAKEGKEIEFQHHKKFTLELNAPRRARRSLDVRKIITWKLQSTIENLVNQLAVVTFAMRIWSEVIPVKFLQVSQDNSKHADIKFIFNQGPFKSYVIGSNLAEGVVAFVQIEDLLSENSYGMPLVHVLLHDVGHALGLPHAFTNPSIMFPIYENDALIEISSPDRKLAQRIYGICKGKFDYVIDWLSENGTAYETFFFRGNYSWLYSNALGRPRYGRQWHNLPLGANAALQIKRNGHIIEGFVFKEDIYYKYIEGAVEPDYPRQVKEDLGCPSVEGPDKIDAAFFDGNIVYIFYEEKVWLYESENFATQMCAFAVVPFTQIFERNDDVYLDGFIDAMYYSLFHNTILIFKDEDMYKVSMLENNGHSNIPRANLTVLGPWYDLYNDICETN